jgi:hypothetical protein
VILMTEMLAMLALLALSLGVLLDKIRRLPKETEKRRSHRRLS